MDFSLTEEQEMLKDSVSKVVETDYDFETRQEHLQSDKGYNDAFWQQCGELGWTAIPFAQDDGGFGGGPEEIMLIMEELGRGLVVEPYWSSALLAGGVLRAAANESQRSQWFEELISGTQQATLAWVERGARYDLSCVRTTARAVDGGYQLSGAKVVVPHLATADLIIVPARTSGEATDDHGITLFVVERQAAGVTVDDYATSDGMRAGNLKLDDVMVTSDHILGSEDEGLAPLVAATDLALLGLCAEAQGILEVLVSKTIEYTRTREQFGRPIGSFQALQHRMVDMFMLKEESRSLLYKAVIAMQNAPAEGAKALSALKYHIGTSGRKVGQEAVQLHGGMGVTWELDVPHYFKRLTMIDAILGNADYHLDRFQRL